MRSILLEVAVEGPVDALAAEGAGADRIELSARLDLGGVTPPPAEMKAARAALRGDLLILIRPRPGDFRYTRGELEAMERDIDAATEAGADGLVLGALDDGHRLNTDAMQRLIACCGRKPVVLHRAFDLTPDPFEALEVAVDLGFQRILTSGRSAHAADATATTLIRGLIDRAAGRIGILPGGGIRPHNVRRLIEATGCDQVHSACRVLAPSRDSPAFDTQLVRNIRREIDAYVADR